MARVGGLRPAEHALAVDRHGIVATLFDPEARLHRLAHDLCPRRPGPRPRRPEPTGDHGHRSPGGESIALNLHQGDGAAGQGAVVMEDRILAVLPALVG